MERAMRHPLHESFPPDQVAKARRLVSNPQDYAPHLTEAEVRQMRALAWLILRLDQTTRRHQHQHAAANTLPEDAE
jgi:hypothetical protein